VTFVSSNQGAYDRPDMRAVRSHADSGSDFDIRILRAPQPNKVTWLSFQLLVRICDIVLVLVGAFAATLIRFDSLAIPEDYLAGVVLAVITLLLVCELTKIYTAKHLASPSGAALRWAAAWSMTMTLILGYLFFTKSGAEFSRLWMFYWFAAALVLVVPMRLLIAQSGRRMVRDGAIGEYIALVGTAENVWMARRALEDKIQLGMVILDKRQVANPIGSAMDEALRQVDSVILAVDHTDEERVTSWLSLCRHMSLDLSLAPRLTPQLLDFGPHQIGGLPVWRLSTKPLSDAAFLVKRAEDLVLGGLLLVVAAPLMAAAALAVKLDSPGPVLFRQTRHGFNNSTFTVFKFRSMTATETTAPDVPQATPSDPRVTRVGWFLRRSSLDELPQLFNVLNGDMSLVGPRPHAVPHNHLFGQQIEDYFRRHRLKPGITGWAQVNALRGETQSIDKMRARVEHDLYYIDNWSLLLDLKILLRTVTVMIHPTAY
jgi:Undecaprenyl-phosphate glucose phosphotransferase